MMNDTNNNEQNTLNDLTQKQLSYYELGTLANNLDRLDSIRNGRGSALQMIILAPIVLVILYVLNKIIDSGILNF